MTRPEDLLYRVDELPPWPRLLFLGIQHAMLMSVYLVLIVIVFRHAGASHAQRAELRNDRFGSVHDASEHLERTGRLGIPRAASIFGDQYWSRRTGGRHWRASGRLRDDNICRLDRDRPSPTAATAPRFVPASDQWVHRHDRRPSA